MNSSVVIFGVFVGLFCWCNAVDPLMEECDQEGPAVYCMSESRAEHCQQTLYCKWYLQDVICPLGPKVYCQLERTAIECGKQEFCSTWAVKVDIRNTERTTTTERTESFGDYMGRVFGGAILNYRSRYGGL